MNLSVNIKKRLPGFTLNVSFDTGQDIMGLLGASGSGKSMTLRCITGIERPDEGRIVLNGRVLFDSEKRIHIPSRERKVGYVFQNYALFPNMTVEENIGFGLGKLTKEKRRAVVENKIEMMKLQGLEKRFPYQLSGGQQQRVALARALAIEPEALLLDEPFSALDDHLRSMLAKQLIDALKDYSGVALFITHNMEEAYSICSELVVLKNGGVEAKGSKEDIFQKPPTLAAAQLTGCKNFSAARYLSNDQLHALDWGLKLKVKEALQEDIEHAGIRANDISWTLKKEGDNVFQCWPSFISEAPFRVLIYLSIGSEPASMEAYHLQWEVSREQWLELKEKPLPWTLCLNPEKILAFSD